MISIDEYLTAPCKTASIPYRFINELRYVEIALLREQFVFADIALSMNW